MVELGHVATELLTQGEGSGVHEVGAAGLDDCVELFGLRRQRVSEAADGGQQVLDDALVRGDVHGRGERVVRALAAVDVVVGLDQLLGAEVTAENLVARFATTSLTFMFDWVPDPVCQTTSGKWSSSCPATISSQAVAIAVAVSAGKSVSSTFVSAAAFLSTANARMISMGMTPSPMRKFSRLRWVCAPQYLSSGTSTGPIVSDSVRVPMRRR